LCIDAEEGIQENSRRHGYLLSMLGVKQICVLVNKMDLVGYDWRVFKSVERKYSKFLKSINIRDIPFIPVSGKQGDNITGNSSAMDWWQGHTVLSLLDTFQKELPSVNLPFRMPVQDVYKFTAQGSKQRIIAGTVSSGRFSVGDELVFYPSGKKSHIASIEDLLNRNPQSAATGMSTGFTVTEQIYIKRGDLAVRADEKKPQTGKLLQVSLFWLGRDPLVMDKEYHLKIGTAKVRMKLVDTNRVIDASNLNTDGMKKMVERHDVADCVIATQHPIAFDLVDDFPQTSRFVIVDGFEIAGGGIIRQVLRDKNAEYRDRVMNRNLKWDVGNITRLNRSERYGHKPALVLVGGPEDIRKANFAKTMEEELFGTGIKVYYLGVQNVLAGLDADMAIKRDAIYPTDRDEMIRRLAELSNILVDAGIVLVATVSELTLEEQETFITSVSPVQVLTIWVGSSAGSAVDADYLIEDTDTASEHLKPVMTMLKENGISV
ncbi:MAG: hypothetical protein B6D68_01025, partial [spirochete symbiont of Stewartia floridana]